MKKLLLLALCIITNLFPVSPIAWDYHGVFFLRDNLEMAQDIAKYVWRAEKKGRLARIGLNPLFWYDVLKIMRDENSADILEALVARYPDLKEHQVALIKIINNDMPMKGTLDILEALHNSGVQHVFASNIHGDSLDYIITQKPFLFDKFSMIFRAREEGHGAKPSTYYFKRLWEAMEQEFGELTKVPFIDDLQENIDGALKANEKWGTNFDPILFAGDASLLKKELVNRGYLSGNFAQIHSNAHEIPADCQNGD